MSTITLDYANCTSERVEEEGLAGGDFRRAKPVLERITKDLNESRGTGWERWRHLPFDPLRSEHVQAVRALAEELRPTTENLVVLGIGGSALGNIALHAALNPPTHNLLPAAKRRGPRLFVLDNVDPQLVASTLQLLRESDPNFERTVVNVISKSGETAETAAQFLAFRDSLRGALGDRHRARVVAVTDPEKGTMRSICDEAGYRTLPVPEGVGGRFSVLSPVGLFSAAMTGIDIDALLDGAAAMDVMCQNEQPEENPAALLGWILTAFARRGKRNHVMMPYSNSLYSLADWFRQLWAESLGKRVDLDGNVVHAGATPIKALGTTDQHSQVQLYREGPNDKVIGFVEVEEFPDDVAIPTDVEVEALRYLAGSTLTELIHAEKRATEYALVESKRPNYTIRFPRLEAKYVGQFMQMWEIATSYAGKIFHVDAYDQPAVETGKVATFGLMGREGYGEWKGKVKERLEGSRWRWPGGGGE